MAKATKNLRAPHWPAPPVATLPPELRNQVLELQARLREQRPSWDTDEARTARQKFAISVGLVPPPCTDPLPAREEPAQDSQRASDEPVQAQRHRPVGDQVLEALAEIPNWRKLPFPVWRDKVNGIIGRKTGRKSDVDPKTMKYAAGLLPYPKRKPKQS